MQTVTETFHNTVKIMQGYPKTMICKPSTQVKDKVVALGNDIQIHHQNKKMD
jgi:hypothetical protein